MFLSFCVFLYTLMHLHTHKYGRTLGMSFSVRCGKMQRAIAVLPMNRDNRITASLYKLVREGGGVSPGLVRG